MKEPIFFEPVFKEMVWGGEKLNSVYHYPIPSDHTGECWSISAHDNGDCQVKNGKHKGKHLSRLWEKNRDLFGNMTGDRFPLLVKIIDAKDDLSIQVHPDDVYAAEHENGSFGKTECWYVLDCEPGTTIVIGHNASDREELKQMVASERWDELIREIPVKKGDFFQIEPGCVHAIKGGTMILETQQNSDITYRLYDYGRLEDGQPRELHIDKSLDVITSPFQEKKVTGNKREEPFYIEETLIKCPYYTVVKLDVDGTAEQNMDKNFQLFSIIEGSGELNGAAVKKGDHFMLPNGFGQYQLSGTLTAISSWID